MKENDNFCGYACGNEIAKQQEIIDELILFSRHSPEWATIMLGKLMHMLYDARLQMAAMTEPGADKKEWFEGLGLDAK